MPTGFSLDTLTNSDSADAFPFASEPHSVPDHRIRDDGEFPCHRDDENLAGFPASFNRLAKADRGGLRFMVDIAA